MEHVPQYTTLMGLRMSSISAMMMTVVGVLWCCDVVNGWGNCTHVRYCTGTVGRWTDRYLIVVHRIDSIVCERTVKKKCRHRMFENLSGIAKDTIQYIASYFNPKWFLFAPWSFCSSSPLPPPEPTRKVLPFSPRRHPKMESSSLTQGSCTRNSSLEPERPLLPTVLAPVTTLERWLMEPNLTPLTNVDNPLLLLQTKSLKDVSEGLCWWE